MSTMTTVTGHEQSDHIRGMMPSFDVLQDAHETLAAENEATRRVLEEERRRRPARPAGRRKRWPWIVGIVAIAAVAVTALTTRQNDSAPPSASTPVDQLPWRVVESPSGSLRVDLPSAAAASAVSSVAGTGQQLTAKVVGYDITVAEFSIGRGPNDARALVNPLIRERADLLDGHVDDVEAVSSRVGLAYEGVITTTAPVGIVRVVLDGSTLYVIEVRGDARSQRARQIFERTVQSFTATRTR